MLNQAKNVFDFLKIKYPDESHKSTLYYLPMVGSCIISIVLMVIASHGENNSNFILSDRFSDLFTLIAILPGFYIAALSAIAAINREAIDKIINESNPPTIKKWEPNRSEQYDAPLTRRVFLSMLFAYLSTISLLLAIALVFIRFLFSLDFMKEYVKIIHITDGSSAVFFIINFLIFFIIIQMVLLTLVGANYLGYKALVND